MVIRHIHVCYQCNAHNRGKHKDMHSEKPVQTDIWTMDKDAVREKTDILSHSCSSAGHTCCPQVTDAGDNNLAHASTSPTLCLFCKYTLKQCYN